MTAIGRSGLDLRARLCRRLGRGIWRYYTSRQLDAILELKLNYLKFLARAVSPGRVSPPPVGASSRPSPPSGTSRDKTAAQGVRQAAGIALVGGLAAVPAFPDDLILALTNGGFSRSAGNRQAAGGAGLMAAKV